MVPTINEVFDAVDFNCTHGGDDIAFQAYDRVFIVDLDTVKYDTNNNITAFNGYEVTADDVVWDDLLNDWRQEDCGPLAHVTLTQDGHVNTLKFL